MFPAHKLLEIVDSNSWFEIGALWGRTAICGLARLAGHPIGVIINNSEVNGGALDTPGSQKLNKHLKFLDVFNIPLVQFIDVPGFAIGTAAERQATMRHGVGLTATYCGTTMPVFNVVTRKAYGVAGQIMIACREPRTMVAWPSGEWGSLPLAGGVEVGHAYELKMIEKEKGKEARQARYDELMELYK
jgi:acetyl-CoA carboxylase carboxyltransferase component